VGESDLQTIAFSEDPREPVSYDTVPQEGECDPREWLLHPVNGEFLETENEEAYLKASFKDRLQAFVALGVPAAIFLSLVLLSII